MFDSTFGTGLVISGVGSKLMKSNTELKWYYFIDPRRMRGKVGPGRI